MIRTSPALRKLNILQQATSRQFNGGLDVADSELNLSSKFARELDNMVPGIDGSLQIKQGTRLFSDIAALSTNASSIIGKFYFAGNLIDVNALGEVFATNAQGVVARIWDANIAADTRPGLQKWGDSTTYVTFLEFDSELIIANGEDKPLVVTAGLIVDYLADRATGSNINVPISHHLQKFNRHVVWLNGSILHVSERDAAGTYTGDSGTVYAAQFDLASYVSIGDAVGVGLLPYKGYLLCFFSECIVPVQFTEIAETDAVPASLQISVSPDSVISNYGLIAPRTLQDVGDMTLALDIVGVSNVTLSTFTKVLLADRPSRLVDPLLQKRTGLLGTEAIHDNCFAIYDRRLSMYMLFIPNTNAPYIRKTHGFGYRYIDSQKIESWNTYSGWNWQCAARSAEGRIFLSRIGDTKTFVLGDSIIDPINRDYVGEQETWSDGTVFTDGTGWSPVSDARRSGVPIRWAWELPWTDLKQRGLTKTLRYVTLDTEGDQRFLMQVFVDDYYALLDGGEPWSDGTLFTDNTGFIRGEPERIPALEIDYIGKDAGGYGLAPYGSYPYGGGNNTKNRKLTLAPTKFTTAKLRFSGEAMGPLKFVSLTLHYQGGTIRRLPL